MIRLSQVTLIRGTKTLLVDADITLNPGDKIGLIGPNGSGKSSLFALLHGLGFSHGQMGEPVASFSGGWRMRLNLAELEAEWLALQEQLETSKRRPTLSD